MIILQISGLIFLSSLVFIFIRLITLDSKEIKEIIRKEKLIIETLENDLKRIKEKGGV